MNKNQLISERERAHLAQQILDNPLWAEAKVTIIDGLSDAWRDTSVTQCQERETLWHMLNAATSAFSYIESVLKTGQLAQTQLEKPYG